MPVLSPDRFGDNVEAHLRYAAVLGNEDGLEILRARLRDASWTRCPDAWLNTANRLAEVRSLEQSCAELASVVSIDPLAHKAGLLAILPNVTRICLDFGDHASVTSLSTSFLAVAEPGDAGVLLDLEGSRRPQTLPREIIDWLITIGCGELRSRERASKVALLAIHFAGGDVQDQRRVLALLRAVVDGEYPAGAWAHGYMHSDNGPLDPDLWSAVEVAIGQDFSPEDLLRLLDIGRRASQDSLLRPLTKEGYPRSRTLLVKMLLDGRLPSSLRDAAWEKAIQLMPPDEPSIIDDDTLFAGLHSLMAAVDGRRRPPTQRWCERLVGMTFDRHGVHHAPPGVPYGIRPLALASLYPAPVRGALEHRLTRASPSQKLACDILGTETAPEAVVPALLTLPSIEPVPIRPVEDFVRLVAEELTDLIAQRWPHISGIDITAILKNARRVAVTQVQGDQVEVDGDTVRLDHDYVRMVRTKGRYDQQQGLRLCALYFIHELVHLAQGLRKKSDVTALRTVGAETTLKHFDLEADHVAASMAARLRPEWGLLELKALQAESLLDFPVGRFHTSASRARKLGRMISIRCDFLARRDGLIEESNEQYVFVEFTPEGGEFVVMSAGRFTRYLGTTHAEATTIKRIQASAGGGDISALDADLCPLLRGALQHE